ncbi:hypothetical protein BFGS084_01572 [Bacteroides fragilis]|nr:hypothetical protein BFGS084_01572 [Bacteroides fragilis]
MCVSLILSIFMSIKAMDQEELHIRILMQDYLERQELKASSVSPDPCADMEPDEMRRYVRFLLGQLEEKQNR